MEKKFLFFYAIIWMNIGIVYNEIIKVEVERQYFPGDQLSPYNCTNQTSCPLYPNLNCVRVNENSCTCVNRTTLTSRNGKLKCVRNVGYEENCFYHFIGSEYPHKPVKSRSLELGVPTLIGFLITRNASILLKNCTIVKEKSVYQNMYRWSKLFTKGRMVSDFTIGRMEEHMQIQVNGLKVDVTKYTGLLIKLIIRCENVNSNFEKESCLMFKVEGSKTYDYHVHLPKKKLVLNFGSKSNETECKCPVVVFNKKKTTDSYQSSKICSLCYVVITVIGIFLVLLIIVLLIVLVYLRHKKMRKSMLESEKIKDADDFTDAYDSHDSFSDGKGSFEQLDNFGANNYADIEGATHEKIPLYMNSPASTIDKSHYEEVEAQT